MKPTLKRILFISLILVAANDFKALAKNYYVSPAGSETNMGTIGKPFRTIKLAAIVAQPGDTVFIREGTYPNLDFINLQGAPGFPIVFKAYPGERVVIDRHAEGSGPYYVINLRGVCKYLVFDGLEVTDSDPLIDTLRALDISKANDLARLIMHYDKLLYRDGIKINRNPTGEVPHHITFKNMEVHHLLGVGFSATAGHHFEFLNNHVYDLGWPRSGYGFYTNGEYILYKGNVIHDCAYGFHITKNYYSIFEGNILYNNGGTYFHMSSRNVKNDGYGLRIWGGGTGNIIRNNIAYDNWAGIRINSTDTRILNNTLYNNRMGILVDGAKNATVRNNICFKNTGRISAGSGNSVDHNLEEDPLFVDAANHDFRLRPSSPAIDAGMPHPDVIDDIDGTPRPRGAALDIGAYEIQ